MPLARPPPRMQAPLSAQIPISLLGVVQLVKGTNAGNVLVLIAAIVFSKQRKSINYYVIMKLILSYYTCWILDWHWHVIVVR